jgi:hypothetical protein
MKRPSEMAVERVERVKKGEEGGRKPSEMAVERVEKGEEGRER